MLNSDAMFFFRCMGRSAFMLEFDTPAIDATIIDCY